MAASIRSSRLHIDSAAQTVSISSASWPSRGSGGSIQRINLITSPRYVRRRTFRIRQIHSSFCLSVSDPLPHDDPDDVDGRNCDQRTENAEEKTSREEGKKHDQSWQLIAASIDQRVEHVALDLGVDDYVREDDHRFGGRDRQGCQDDWHRTELGADHRDQVEDCEQNREG